MIFLTQFSQSEKKLHLGEPTVCEMFICYVESETHFHAIAERNSPRGGE